ncbi:acetyl esterase [Verrucomicrobia bacterium LW23]|nr:acetyl esterase [Verrucomicrobia bacterium LW23]
MKSRFLIGGALMAFMAGATLSAKADVKLPLIFSDHAVLQKAAKVPVWGKADPDEAVTVTLDGVTATTKADADGKWRVDLDLKDKGEGPYELLIEGKNKITIKDVLVGDVWVCSGQSNMEWIVKNSSGAAEEVPRSANPRLRQFLVVKNTSAVPLTELKDNKEPAKDLVSARWVSASPETTERFTAVGYYFGKMLNAELKKPIGLIHTSWGGTPSEAWTSPAACATDPDLDAARERMHQQTVTYQPRLDEFAAAFPVWTKKYEREDTTASDTAPAARDLDTADWKKVSLPGEFKTLGLPDTGIVWLRKTVNLTGDAVKKDLKVSLGNINGFDIVYVNGTRIGAATTKSGTLNANREYTAPAKALVEGDNVIAIRVYNPSEGAGLTTPGWNSHFRYGAANTPLKGEWLARAEKEFPAMSPEAKAEYVPVPPRPPGPQNVPTYLYNAMIEPLLPYAITGAIWYQGESNAGRAENYGKVFPLMITDWRAKWGQGDFPFLFCQLANYMGKKDQPGDSAWAELRESQTKTLSLPNTGMGVLIDIGESADIHPRNKKDAGERLAKYALAKTYGQKIAYSGPQYKAMSVEGNKIRLTFDHTDGGLTAKKLGPTYDVNLSKNETAPLVLPVPDSELQGFAICGQDKVWKWAKATIENDSIVVSAEGVDKPVAVRYAWADNPTCNLYNGAGLPAIPFRTDDFPMTTAGKKY